MDLLRIEFVDVGIIAMIILSTTMSRFHMTGLSIFNTIEPLFSD